MTLLVVALPTGPSWRAPDLHEPLGALVAEGHVSEAVLLPARGELYAESATFHGGIARIAEALAPVCGCTVSEFGARSDPSYDTPAAHRLFAAAAGLTSPGVHARELAAAAAGEHVGEHLQTLLTEALHVADAIADALRQPAPVPDQLVQQAARRYAASRRSDQVTPTLTALREQAHAVVQQELARFDARRPDLDADERAEVTRAAYRVAEQLLNAPTLRIEELEASAERARYTSALRALFGLGAAP